MKIKTFIFKLKDKTDAVIEIVGLGDKSGADKHIKKYALELGYEYREMNPAHTPKTLYSLMTEAYYNKPYSPKNFFQQTKIYSQYIHKCVLFDNTDGRDKKVNNIVRELGKLGKTSIIITE